MIILGVDPGLGTTGYGIIKCEKQQFRVLEAGIIKSSSREILPERLSRIYKGIQDVTRQYQPRYLVLEKIYSHYQHQMTAIAMAHARGVIAVSAAQFPNLELISYPAKRVKKALTGNGNASKLQVQRTVQSILNLKELPTPEDVGDALALALTQAYMMNATNLGE